jgi:hypothetical protein
MGYDMHYRKADPAEAAEVEFARMVFQAACDERDALPEAEKGRFNVTRAKVLGDWETHEVYDGRTERYREAQDKAHAAYEAMYAAEKSYFRLNVWGMGSFCDLMAKAGMAFDDPTCPGFPEAAEFGITRDQGWAAMDPGEYPAEYAAMTGAEREAGAKFAARWQEVIAWHGTERPGIPLHKFSSNDGWHVLPAEADAAVRIWRQFVADNGEEAAANLVNSTLWEGAIGDHWARWLTYLAGAVRHEGFEVR